MGKIGIFWVYKGIVLGKSRALSEGRENIRGLIDSPDSHIELWEESTDFEIPFAELTGSEYQEIPRGRVIFSTKHTKYIVYMDEVLHQEITKLAISEFFGLRKNEIKWETDPHYVTDQRSIDRLFDD
ncbi:hypothetical protein DJ030_01415 [bacterium endosymbiont of Escarpia laminata]|nr:MAG: hypothetical protein DJ030_01415 [bacterium endosymbiont of Escarpia laminata]